MKTAIFLGAGASKADGAPLQNEIFKQFFEMRHEYENTFFIEMRKMLSLFFEKFFSVDVENKIHQFPTFEEVLGILDLAEMRNETFKGLELDSFFSNKNLNIRYIRQCIVLLMAKIISTKLMGANLYHKKLVENLLEKKILKETSFISTNYDILVDNALVSLYPSQKLDYGVDFTNFYRENDWIRPSKTSIKLYKIHGSLNWLYCPTCNTLTLTQLEKGILKLMTNNLRDAQCRKCKSIITPIVVPPTYFKNMSNVYLSIIWNKAEFELRNVQHFIFCGYSFPEADIHIKYLLKRIQTNKNKKLKVTVLNHYHGKSKEVAQIEESRFIRFFGNIVDYKENSFEDFANQPEQFWH